MIFTPAEQVRRLTTELLAGISWVSIGSYHDACYSRHILSCDSTVIVGNMVAESFCIQYWQLHWDRMRVPDRSQRGSSLNVIYLSPRNCHRNRCSDRGVEEASSTPSLMDGRY